MLDGSSVVLIGSRTSAVLRYGAATTMCALAAHAVAYGSLVPQDGEHRYFGWYAPFVATLSAAALLCTGLALVVALVCGPTSRAAAAVRSLLPARSAEDSAVAGLFRIASAALVFLAVQESLERSFTASRIELVSFTPSALALLVATVLLAAAVVVLVQVVVSSLANVVLRVDRTRTTRAPASRWHRARAIALRPIRPLAVHGGLRAPPLPS